MYFVLFLLLPRNTHTCLLAPLTMCKKHISHQLMLRTAKMYKSMISSSNKLVAFVSRNNMYSAIGRNSTYLKIMYEYDMYKDDMSSFSQRIYTENDNEHVASAMLLKECCDIRDDVASLDILDRGEVLEIIEQISTQ